MPQKTQTIIVYPDGCIAKRMDDFLYQPVQLITVNGVEYRDFTVTDEFDEDMLLRKIRLIGLLYKQ